MRILLINWRDPFDPKSGGAEQVTLEHAKAWIAAGHHVVWVSGTYAGAQREEIIDGITYFRSGSSTMLFLRAWWIYWMTFSGNFDVVVDQVHGMPAFSPVWAWKSARVAFIHEVAGDIWHAMFSWPIAVVGRFFERYIFPVVYANTLFWVDCTSTKSDLVELGISKKRIVVIPCAPAEAELVELEKNKTLQLVFIARLVPMKGLHTAVAVLRDILIQQPKAQLYVIGSGDAAYITEVQSQAVDISNNVVFLGKVSEQKKNQVLRQSHFLLHTSIKEGFGLTVLEAARQKTPSAVFDVHGLRDLVIANKTGVIAPFADSKRLADYIVQTYLNRPLFTRMSEYAYNYSRKFEWSRFTKQSLHLLEQVIK